MKNEYYSEDLFAALLQSVEGIDRYPGLVAHTQAVVKLVRAACEHLGVHPLVRERAVALAWLHDAGKPQWLLAAGSKPRPPSGVSEVRLAMEALDAVGVQASTPGQSDIRLLMPYLDPRVLTACQFMSLPLEPRIVVWADLHCAGDVVVDIQQRKMYVKERYFGDDADGFVPFWSVREAFLLEFSTFYSLRTGKEANPFEMIKDSPAESDHMILADHIRLSRDLGGWLYPNEDRLLDKLVGESMAVEGSLCEVGSWRGRSTVIVAGAAGAEGKSVCCIDDWRGGTDADCVRLAGGFDIYSEFLSNTQQHGTRIRTLRGLSNEVERELPDRVAFAFLDGAHDYSTVLQEASMFSARMPTGAILAFHDADNPRYPDVRAVVDVLMKAGDWEHLDHHNFLVGLRKVR